VHDIVFAYSIFVAFDNLNSLAKPHSLPDSVFSANHVVTIGKKQALPSFNRTITFKVIDKYDAVASRAPSVSPPPPHGRLPPIDKHPAEVLQSETKVFDKRFQRDLLSFDTAKMKQPDSAEIAISSGGIRAFVIDGVPAHVANDSIETRVDTLLRSLKPSPARLSAVSLHSRDQSSGQIVLRFNHDDEVSEHVCKHLSSCLGKVQLCCDLDIIYLQPDVPM
jgi:hypothetical protein